jgi:hypothetical protein
VVRAEKACGAVEQKKSSRRVLDWLPDDCRARLEPLEHVCSPRQRPRLYSLEHRQIVSGSRYNALGDDPDKIEYYRTTHPRQSAPPSGELATLLHARTLAERIALIFTISRFPSHNIRPAQRVPIGKSVPANSPSRSLVG